MTTPSRWKQLYQLGAKTWHICKKELANQKGMTVLLPTIFVGLAILIIGLSIGFNSISSSSIIIDQQQSQQLLANAETCADEALVKLSRNDSYNGEILTLGQTSCTITVNNQGGETYQILVAATQGNYQKNLDISISLAPAVAINSWREI